jgi:hypothetical protein
MRKSRREPLNTSLMSASQDNWYSGVLNTR